jgi:hypothetical protein
MDKSIQRVVEIQLEKAKTLALRIHAASSSVVPVEWTDLHKEVFLVDVLEFAYHARCVSNACIPKDVEFDIDFYSVEFTNEPAGERVNKYHHALNRFHHMKSITIGYTHSDHRKIYSNSESNLILTYARIETDKYNTSIVSLFGVVFCFLTKILLFIRDRYPDLKV